MKNSSQTSKASEAEPKSSSLEEASTDLDSRSRLIKIAAQLFAQRGFAGASTRDIAREAQVNISLISYYFKGKEGLYLAVLEDFFGRAQREMEQVFSSFDVQNMTRESFKAQMTEIINRMVEMKSETPYVSQLLHRELLAGLPNAKEYLTQLFQTMSQTLIEMLHIAQKKNIIRSDIHVPTHFMTLVHSTDTYFLITQSDSPARNVILKLPEQKREYCDQMVKVFIEGVMK